MPTSYSRLPTHSALWNSQVLPIPFCWVRQTGRHCLPCCNGRSHLLPYATECAGRGHSITVKALWVGEYSGQNVGQFQLLALLTIYIALPRPLRNQLHLDIILGFYTQNPQFHTQCGGTWAWNQQPIHSFMMRISQIKRENSKPFFF